MNGSGAPHTSTTAWLRGFVQLLGGESRAWGSALALVVNSAIAFLELSAESVTSMHLRDVPVRSLDFTPRSAPIARIPYQFTDGRVYVDIVVMLVGHVPSMSPTIHLMLRASGDPFRQPNQPHLYTLFYARMFPLSGRSVPCIPLQLAFLSENREAGDPLRNTLLLVNATVRTDAPPPRRRGRL